MNERLRAEERELNRIMKTELLLLDAHIRGLRMIADTLDRALNEPKEDDNG